MTAFTGLPVYASREDVQRALDAASTARTNDQIDRLLDAASRGIDDDCARYFYPRSAMLFWDWPNVQMGRSYRLWLDRDELLSLTSVTTGGSTLDPSQFTLEPNRSGPPYSRIEVNLGGSAGAFGGGATFQQAIGVTGVFGFTNATTTAGTLGATITSGATSLTVSDSSLVGVGDTLLIGSEYMQVTDRRMLDTGQAITGTIAAQANAVSVTVSNGAAFDIGEVLLLDSERVLITDIAGNVLTVKRAWDGTVLAAHTSSEVWAARTLLITRGTLGTSVVSHTSGAAVAKHAPPALIRQLAIAETMNALQQEGSAYQAVQQRSRQAGASGSARNTMTQVAPIDDLRDRVQSVYGRNSRIRVV